MDKNTIYKIKKYLEDENLAHIDNEKSKMQLRSEGKEFTTEEHIKGMIYSLLSAQTVWANIEANFTNIDKLFFNYNVSAIKNSDAQFFIDGLGALRCRSRLTNAQMRELHYNISVMEQIVCEYGSMDKYVTSKSQIEIVRELSDANSKYKLKQMGPALVWEYLRNVGIDGAKPDVHMKRILGSNRLGVSKYENATDDEVFQTCKKLAEETGLWMAEIDYLMWLYCATDRGEICTAHPNCEKCVIRKECKYNQMPHTKNEIIIKQPVKKKITENVQNYSLDDKYDRVIELMQEKGIKFTEEMPDHVKNRYRIMKGGSSVFIKKSGYVLYCSDRDAKSIQNAINIDVEPNYKNKTKKILDQVRPNTIRVASDLDFDTVIECLLNNYENR